MKNINPFRIFLVFWTSRELIYNLVLKDLKARYKSSLLGFLWALLNPLVVLLVLSTVFTFFVRIDVSHYPIFLMAGFLPWHFTAQSISGGTNAIVESGSLIKKVYFPREVLPIAVNLAQLVHFLISLILLVPFLIYFAVRINWALIPLLPVVIFLQLLFNVGFSLATSSLNVRYRDVRYLVDMGLLIWFYMSPVFYPLSMVPDRFQNLYLLNPMADLISLYRGILIDREALNLNVVLLAMILPLLVLSLGQTLFKKQEVVFDDIL